MRTRVMPAGKQDESCQRIVLARRSFRFGSTGNRLVPPQERYAAITHPALLGGYPGGQGKSWTP
ncbi:hypothetical protein Ais01nite_74930 [Asanoa ishikariensis]|nr:hypothetical protein Ais01nite_74930 [Asanoa ishikariensis]